MNQKTLAKEIKKLQDRNGRITPEAIVHAAANPKHPLHSCFEWDDGKAAFSYRVQQARDLIRRVVGSFVVGTRTVRTVGYVRDPEVPERVQGYRAVVKLRDDIDEAREVLVGEMARISALIRRARDLGAVFGLTERFDAIDVMITDLGNDVRGQATAGRA